MKLADQKVLLTGGGGFLGGHVIEALLDAGARDVITPRKAYHDLREAGAARDLMEEHRPTVVIHLAASVGGIGANQEHPAEYFYDNAVMGIHLMHEAFKANVTKFVTVGTVCSYPKHTPAPFRELSLWDGYPEETNAPYGIAKKMLLVMGQAYRRQYGFNAIHLLPTNLYGPGDNFDPNTSHVIPAMIRRFDYAARLGLDEVTLWGTGKATRDFLYVEDAARAIVIAAEKYNSPAPINVGSGNEVSIRELADRIAPLCQYGGAICWDDTKPDGQPRRVLDITSARNVLGWEPTTPISEGLQNTVRWYQEEYVSHARD